MEALISVLLEIVLSFLALLASRYIIPWIKEKRIYQVALLAVEAAEQVLSTEDGAGKVKFEEVKKYLCKKFKLSDEDVERIIESAVYNMKNKK